MNRSKVYTRDMHNDFLIAPSNDFRMIVFSHGLLTGWFAFDDDRVTDARRKAARRGATWAIINEANDQTI